MAAACRSRPTSCALEGEDHDGGTRSAHGARDERQAFLRQRCCGRRAVAGVRRRWPLQISKCRKGWQIRQIGGASAEKEAVAKGKPALRRAYIFCKDDETSRSR